MYCIAVEYTCEIQFFSTIKDYDDYYYYIPEQFLLSHTYLFMIRLREEIQIKG
jgi:hypothetical protein